MDRSKSGSSRLAFKEGAKPAYISSSLLSRQLFSSGIHNRIRNSFLLLTLVWFVVNFLQSIFTDIGNDEAYYWMYARDPDWGYFDHPPLIAIFIMLGGYFFPGELGVRFFIILSQLLTIFVTWRLINEPRTDDKKIYLFFILLAFIPVFQIYGFIATPDAILLLFISLFLLAYSNFLNKPVLINVIFLGAAMSGLLYSKYHGALVILFVILSNIRLLITSRFLMACMIAFCLLIPHFYWQFENGWPTLQFQMVDRMNPVSLDYFVEFWLQQLAAFNPIILFFLLIAVAGIKISDPFTKALVFITTGFFCFFWITSLWTRPEPHWTVAATVPAVVLLYRYVTTNHAAQKIVFKSLVPILAILLLARLSLVIENLPFKLEFHGQQSWANEIASAAGSLPVVFTNSYQKPSVYTFYSGMPAFTINSIHYHQNQYDLWNFEEQYHQKEVAMYVHQNRVSKNDHIMWKDHDHVLVRDTFNSLQKIRFHYDIPPDILFRAGSLFRLPVEITNPYPYPIILNHPHSPIVLVASFGANKTWTFSEAALSKDTLQLLPNQTIRDTITFTVPPDLQGVYNFSISVKTDKRPPALNSPIKKMMIRP